MVSRLKLQYCKVVIATSLVWFLLDVFLLMYFTDCTMSSEACEHGEAGRRVAGGASGPRHGTTQAPGGLLGRLIPNGECIFSKDAV